MKNGLVACVALLFAAGSNLCGGEEGSPFPGVQEISVGEGPEAIKVLTATPMEWPAEKKPVFIECRQGRLFLIPLEDIQRRADEMFHAAIDGSEGSNDLLVRKLESAEFETAGHRVSLVYALIGQLALEPRAGAEGCDASPFASNKIPDCLAEILKGADPQTERIVLVVRGARPEYQQVEAHLKSLGFPLEVRQVPPEGPLKFPALTGPAS